MNRQSVVNCGFLQFFWLSSLVPEKFFVWFFLAKQPKMTNRDVIAEESHKITQNFGLLVMSYQLNSRKKKGLLLGHRRSSLKEGPRYPYTISGQVWQLLVKGS